MPYDSDAVSAAIKKSYQIVNCKEICKRDRILSFFPLKHFLVGHDFHKSVSSSNQN